MVSQVCIPTRERGNEETFTQGTLVPMLLRGNAYRSLVTKYLAHNATQI